jgi:hypothetical protein
VSLRQKGPNALEVGSFFQPYTDGSEREWPIIGFSPCKNDLTLYRETGSEEAGGLLARLGTHTLSTSCLHLKRLDDVDPSVLRELIEDSVRRMAPRRVDR